MPRSCVVTKRMRKRLLHAVRLQRVQVPAPERRVADPRHGRAIAVARAGCQEPLRREPARGPQHDVKPAASTYLQSESRAADHTVKAMSTAPRVWEDRCAHLGTLVRYADDCVIICDTQAAVEEARRRVGLVLSWLGLRLHPGEDEGGRPLARARGRRLSRLPSAQTLERSSLGAGAATRLLSPALAVAACHGAGAGSYPSGDPSTPLSHRCSRHYCRRESGGPRLGGVLSDGQCGAPVSPTG